MYTNSANIIPQVQKKKKKDVCDWKECFTLSGLKADIV